MLIKFNPANPKLVAVYDLFEQECKEGSYRKRSLAISASLASYGSVGHWVLSIVGSPPKGAIIYGATWENRDQCTFTRAGRCRMLKGAKLKVVQDFLKDFEQLVCLEDGAHRLTQHDQMVAKLAAIGTK